MKTLFWKPIRFLSALGLVVWAAGSAAGAQASAQLAIQMYAGLSITGAVGTVYSVEYVTDLAHTNAWRCLEFLQLPASPYLWADKSVPATGRRFYRAVAFARPRTWYSFLVWPIFRWDCPRPGGAGNGHELRDPRRLFWRLRQALPVSAPLQQLPGLLGPLVQPLARLRLLHRFPGSAGPRPALK
jgi:hypothetical protein